MVLNRRTSGLASALILGCALAAWALAPPGRYTVTADTVVDHKARILWQRDLSASAYTWADAATYCRRLTLAGASGWRLPTIKELQSLLDLQGSTVHGKIDDTAFTGDYRASWFWTSTPYARTADSAWQLEFYRGTNQVAGITTTALVKCVR
jgi:hypothetical protein